MSYPGEGDTEWNGFLRIVNGYLPEPLSMDLHPDDSVDLDSFGLVCLAACLEDTGVDVISVDFAGLSRWNDIWSLAKLTGGST